MNIIVSVKDITNIENKYLGLNVLDKVIIDFVAEGLEIFRSSLITDTEFPKDFFEALNIAQTEDGNTVALVLEFSNSYLHTNFGNRVEYELYRCPRRKYFGGKIAPQYLGSKLLQRKWEEKKAEILENIKNRISEYIRSGGV